MKIFLFILHFGTKVHNYFQLYLDSIARNSDILRVFWISNYNISHYDVPRNVLVVPYELDTIRFTAARILSRDYKTRVHHSGIIQKPYKLCDFRPLYPAIFEHLLEGQNATGDDFIGFGDLDLIWGNIAHLIPAQKLVEHHLIGVFGHFTIYRNLPTFKEAYRQLSLDQLLSPLPHELDEKRFSTILQEVTLAHEWKVLRTDAFVGDVTPWQFRSYCKDDRRAERNMLVATGRSVDYFHYSAATQQLLQHDARTGELTEVLYCHLQKRSMTPPVPADGRDDVAVNNRGSNSTSNGEQHHRHHRSLATDLFILKYGFSYKRPPSYNVKLSLSGQAQQPSKAKTKAEKNDVVL